jgi:hypothetical protein
MEKLFSAILFLSAFACFPALHAQDCDEIVLPHVGYDRAKLELMSKEKIRWYCTYSKNSFFVTNDVPEGSVVRDIRDVVYKRTGEKIGEGFVVDLTKMSYYAYNFAEFQYENYGKTIYFHTPGSTYKYLGLYSMDETYRRADVYVKEKE